MDEPQSISAVVQSIMETLSDAVNQLILLVIALQEANAAMPAHIPPAAEAVAGAGTTLTDIARNLAKEEYEDYPDIHDEIIQISDEMDAAGAELIRAVNAINKVSDRKAGWDTLLQACRVISGKTIRILEIVYGAEIKRLLFIAEETRRMMDGVRLNLVDSDPDAFAENVGALASKANELSQHIKQSAQDEESPLMREELTKGGDSLADQSVQLIETANALLAAPNDPALKKKYAEEVESLEDQIQRSTAPLKDKLQDIQQRSNPEELLPNKPSKQPEKNLEKAHSLAPSAVYSAHSSAPSSARLPGVPHEHKPLVSAFVAANKSIAEVAKHGIRKDNVAHPMKSAASSTDKLLAAVKEVANTSNPELADLLADLDQHTKDAVAAANEVDDSYRPDAKDELRDALKNLSNDVARIADRTTTPPESLEVVARKELTLLDVLEVATKHQDPAAIAEDINSLVQTQQQLLPLAKAETNNPNIPASRKKQLEDAVSDLDRGLPYLVKAAKDIIEEGSPDQQQEYADIAAVVDAALHNILGEAPSAGKASPFTFEVEKERALGGQLATAAEKGDLKGVELALKDINAVHPQLSSKARNSASSLPDPRQKQKVEDALRSLDSLIPQQAVAARELLSKPRDPAKKSKLADINKKIAKDLGTIEDTLASSASPDGDDLRRLLQQEKQGVEQVAKSAPTALKDVEQAANRIKAIHPRLAEKATAAAKAIPDAQVQDEVQNALAELAQLLPKQESIAKDLAKAPHNAAKKAERDAVSQKAQVALDTIERALFGSPAHKPRAELEDKLVDAAARGDPKAVELALKDLHQSHLPLRNKAKSSSNSASVPPATKSKLTEALQDLDRLLPLQSSAAAALAKEPANNATRNKLLDINKKIDDDLDSLADLVGDVPSAIDDELDKLLNAEQAAANRLADAALADKPAAHGVSQATKDLKDNHPRLVAKAKAAAANKPAIKHAVQQYLDELEGLVPHLETAAKDAPQAPQDVQKQAEIDDVNDQIQAAVEGLRDVLYGKEPRKPASRAAIEAKKAKGLAADALNSAKGGDLRATERALKDLKDVNAALPRKLRNAVSKIPEPSKQQDGFGTLRHVEPLLKELEAATQEVARNPRDPAKKNKAEELLKQVNQDLDKLADILGATDQDVPVAAKDSAAVRKQTQKQQVLAAKLADAANKGDSPAVTQAIKDINDAYVPMASKARNAAASKNKKPVEKALSDIQAALPKQAAAAKDLVSDPKNPTKKAALNKANANVTDLLNELASLVDEDSKTGNPAVDKLLKQERDYISSAAAAAEGGDKYDAIAANNGAHSLLPELKKEVLKDLDNAPAPVQHKIQDALDKLAELLPQQEQAIGAVLNDPKNPEKTEELGDITRQLDDYLSAIADNLGQQEVQKEAQLVKDSLAELQDAINSDDSNAAEAAVSALADKPAALLSAARRAAQATQDPESKQQILGVIEEAEKVLPMILESVMMAVKDKGDAGAKSATKKTLDSVDKLIDEIANIIKPSPEVESVASANRAASALAALVEAAAKGDVVGVEKAADKLLDVKPKLIRTTREAADSLADPNRRRKLFGAIDNVDDAFPAVVAAARELAANPNNAAALEKLHAAQKNADTILKDITEDSGMKTLAEAKKLEADLDLLDAMVAMEDPEAVVDAIKDFAKRQPLFLVAARAQADSVEHEMARQNMQQPLTRLGKMLPELLSDVHAVVKAPGGEQPRKKLAKSIAEAKRDVGAAAAAVKSAPPAVIEPTTIDEGEGVAAAAAVEELVPELQAAVVAARDRPNDETAQKRLAAIVDKISKPLEAVINSSGDESSDSTPAAQAAASAEAAKHAARELVKRALAGDGPAVTRSAKDLGARHKDFVTKAKVATPRLNKTPEKAKQLGDALNDLNSIVGQLEAAAKDVAQKPTDQKARKKLLNLNKALDDQLKLAKDVLRPPRPAKQANAPDKAQKRLNIVLGKGKPGEVPNPEPIRKLRRSGREIDELAADSPIDFLKGRRIGDAIADLEKRLADKNKANAGPEFNDPVFRDAKKAIENAIEGVKQHKNTPLHASIHQANAGVKQLQGTAYQRDPQRVVAAMKGLAAKQNKVIEQAKAVADKTPDKARKAAINDAIKKLEGSLPQQVVATKEAVQNPGDEAFDKLADVSVGVELALAEIVEAANPSPLATIARLAKKEESELPKLIAAAKSGDQPAVQEALKNISALNDELVDQARKEVSKNLPAKVEELNNTSQQLSALIKQLPAVAQEALYNNDGDAHEKLANLTKEIRVPLGDVVDIASQSPPQEQPGQEAKAQARAILASMKTKPGTKLNPNHLIKASQHLAGLMADLVGQTKLEAYQQKEKGGLNERAKAALDLDSVLSEMEASAKVAASKQRNPPSKPAAIQSLEAVLASLTAAASSVSENRPPAANRASLKPPARNPQNVASASQKPSTLSDSISIVVRDIQSRATDNDSLSVVSRDLAAELQRFAKADQERRRQDMLISGRAISSHILRLITEIKNIAARCKDAVLQDKLLRHAQALRNYSVQLKILAAVKAASNDDSASNAQLATITEALGNVLTDVSITVTILRKSKKI